MESESDAANKTPPPEVPLTLVAKSGYVRTGGISNKLKKGANEWSSVYDEFEDRLQRTPIDCAADELFVADKCWKRVIKDTLKADGYFIENVWRKEYRYNVDLQVQDPPRCTYITEWVREAVWTPRGEPQRYRWVERRKKGTVLACVGIDIPAQGVIQQRYEKLPCVPQGDYEFFGYKLPVGPMDTNEGLMDGRFKKMGERVWAFDENTLITLDEARALCGALRNKAFDGDGFQGACGVHLNYPKMACPGANCTYPGSVSEAFREIKCPRAPVLDFKIPPPFASSGTIRPGDMCESFGYEAPTGFIYRDKDTAWPKGFCPTMVEIFRKCTGPDAEISGSGETIKPTDPSNGVNCPPNRPLKLGGLCTCECPPGSTRDKNSPSTCINRYGKRIDPCSTENRGRGPKNPWFSNGPDIELPDGGDLVESKCPANQLWAEGRCINKAIVVFMRTKLDMAMEGAKILPPYDIKEMTGYFGLDYNTFFKPDYDFMKGMIGGKFTEQLRRSQENGSWYNSPILMQLNFGLPWSPSEFSVALHEGKGKNQDTYRTQAYATLSMENFVARLLQKRRYEEYLKTGGDQVKKQLIMTNNMRRHERDRNVQYVPSGFFGHLDTEQFDAWRDLDKVAGRAVSRLRLCPNSVKNAECEETLRRLTDPEILYKRGNNVEYEALKPFYGFIKTAIGEAGELVYIYFPDTPYEYAIQPLPLARYFLYASRHQRSKIWVDRGYLATPNDNQSTFNELVRMYPEWDKKVPNPLMGGCAYLWDDADWKSFYAFSEPNAREASKNPCLDLFLLGYNARVNHIDKALDVPPLRD